MHSVRSVGDIVVPSRTPTSFVNSFKLERVINRYEIDESIFCYNIFSLHLRMSKKITNFVGII